LNSSLTELAGEFGVANLGKNVLTVVGRGLGQVCPT